MKTKKTLARSKKPRGNGAPKAETPTPAPKFTLTQICQAFGYGIGRYENGEDPIYLARNALDDAHRVLRLVEECLNDGVDTAVLQDVVSNAAMRCQVADGVLASFTHPLSEASK